MPKFKVEVRRCRKIWEVGTIEIEADNREHAAELANELDDPDIMEETSSSIENWECEVKD